MRLAACLASLTSLLLAGACATSPATSPGQLAKASDLSYQCDDSAHSPDFSCGTSLTLAGNQLTATGFYKDGTPGGPGATATLTPDAAARLAQLVGQVPLDTPDTVHESGCGGPPLRSTSFSVAFDNGEVRDFQYQYGTGAIQNLDEYVLQLLGEIRACHGADITFASCTPNTAE